MNNLKLAQAVIGLAILALGITLTIAVEGPDPWGLFILALHRRLPLSLGVTTQVGGLMLVAVNWVWGRRRPGVATIMSMVLVGLFIDLYNGIMGLEAIDGLGVRVVVLAAGITALALGISVYVRAGLGEGPVEGMMFVLSNKLRLGVGPAKVAQDLSFLVLAWVLGVLPRWGTVVTALSVGPLTQGFLRLFSGMKKAPEAPK
ncbi:MAG: hypothetical protein GX090_05575 [Firmicutes bacterium]|nr:hypothetical protein [Bacillota bacterium]HPZ89811.1 hypothetical protein [Bacillota bacterium]HQE01173.1 hypothetical protein [Bacillota bacterium]